MIRTDDPAKPAVMGEDRSQYSEMQALINLSPYVGLLSPLEIVRQFCNGSTRP